MKILLLDTTGPVCGAAICSDGKLIAEKNLVSGRNHSVQALPMIHDLLQQSGLQLDEIDAYASVCGPGSFTGIRIGISTMRAFADAKKKPCIGLNALEVLAWNALPYDGLVCPLIDARAGQAYTALFSLTNGMRPVRVQEDQAVHFAEYLDALQPKGPVLFLGDGVYALRELIQEKLGKLALFAPEHQIKLRAGTACMLADDVLRVLKEDPAKHPMMPYYLKASQAEREREAQGNR